MFCCLMYIYAMDASDAMQPSQTPQPSSSQSSNTISLSAEFTVQELLLWILGVVCAIETVMLIIIAYLNYRRRTQIDNALTALNVACDKSVGVADTVSVAVSWLVELISNPQLRMRVNESLSDMQPERRTALAAKMHEYIKALHYNVSNTVDENGDQVVELVDSVFLG